jgi:hypothetical protein
VIRLRRSIEDSARALALKGTRVPRLSRFARIFRQNDNPNDLGEAPARKRMTMLTHSRTRMEIRDCCVFWAILADPVYDRQLSVKPDGPDTESQRIACNLLSGAEMSVD